MVQKNYLKRHQSLIVRSLVSAPGDRRSTIAKGLQALLEKNDEGALAHDAGRIRGTTR